MRNIIIILLLITSYAMAQDMSGTGTSSDPYMIYNAADFDSIRYVSSSAYYELANDIDMSSYSTWTPLPIFTGALDMNYHTISNLTVSDSGSLASGGYGLFIELNNVTSDSIAIRDGYFVNISFTIIDKRYDPEHGILAGILLDTKIYNVNFLNCNLSVKRRLSKVPSTSHFLAGIVAGKLLNRTSLIQVSADSCYVGVGTDQITSVAEFGAGGLAGEFNSLSSNYPYISQSSFQGRVENFAVSGTGLAYAGGLIAIGYSSIKIARMNDSYFKGTVKGFYYVGGLFGIVRSTFAPYDNQIIEINNCYVAADTIITYHTSKTIEGYLAGKFNYGNKIYNSYADSSITVNSGLITSNGNGTEPTVIELKSSTLMKKTYIYIGWDFTNIWDFTNSYPSLRRIVKPSVTILTPATLAYYFPKETVYITADYSTSQYVYSLGTILDTAGAADTISIDSLSFNINDDGDTVLTTYSLIVSDLNDASSADTIIIQLRPQNINITFATVQWVSLADYSTDSITISYRSIALDSVNIFNRTKKNYTTDTTYTDWIFITKQYITNASSYTVYDTTVSKLVKPTVKILSNEQIQFKVEQDLGTVNALNINATVIPDSVLYSTAPCTYGILYDYASSLYVRDSTCGYSSTTYRWNGSSVIDSVNDNNLFISTTEVKQNEFHLIYNGNLVSNWSALKPSGSKGSYNLAWDYHFADNHNYWHRMYDSTDTKINGYYYRLSYISGFWTLWRSLSPSSSATKDILKTYASGAFNGLDKSLNLYYTDFSSNTTSLAPYGRIVFNDGINLFAVPIYSKSYNDFPLANDIIISTLYNNIYNGVRNYFRGISPKIHKDSPVAE